MIRRYIPKYLSAIPLLAASFLVSGNPPASAQQAAAEIFSSKKVVYSQQESQDVRDLLDKRLPQMERRMIDIEQKINQLATAQPANVPAMTINTPPSAMGGQFPSQAQGTSTPQQPKTEPQAAAADALLEELYGEDGQDAIPAELQVLLSFDPNEVSLEGATFVGCVNDQAMFRGANSKPFFVPATYALNHEAVRLIGGCSQ